MTLNNHIATLSMIKFKSVLTPDTICLIDPIYDVIIFFLFLAAQKIADARLRKRLKATQ